jgi:hypothetical protein
VPRGRLVLPRPPVTCLVIAAALPEGDFGVRDSKDTNGPVLRFTVDEWRAFVRDVKAASPGI